MAPKRLMQLEEYLACPQCGSKDWEKEGPEGEIKTFTCMNKNCGGAFQRAYQFTCDDCKPWMRPHTAIIAAGALPGRACCVDHAARTGKKRCHLHDSVNYTQTKDGSWYYATPKPKPRPPQLRPPRRIVEGEIPRTAFEAANIAKLRKAGLLNNDGNPIPAVPMDVTRRASESVKQFTESTQKVGEAAVKAGDAFVDIGEAARDYRDSREAVPLNEKPGGTPTADGWSGEGKTTNGMSATAKVLMLMIIAALVAYFVTWGLDWVRSL